MLEQWSSVELFGGTVTQQYGTMWWNSVVEQCDGMVWNSRVEVKRCGRVGWNNVEQCCRSERCGTVVWNGGTMWCNSVEHCGGSVQQYGTVGWNIETMWNCVVER